MCYIHTCNIRLNASCSLQEREVDTPEGPTLNVTNTVEYIYNPIHGEAQAKVN